jgi:hypothetical protein
VTDGGPVRLAHRLLDLRSGLKGVHHLFVGIDAGTSGIRVAVRDEYSGRNALVDFGPNAAGGTRFSFPTTIGVAGNRFVFGNQAVATEPRRRLVSVKAALVHPNIGQILNEQWRSLGLTAVAGNAKSSIAEMLYSVLIARALEQALPTLAGSFGHRSDATLAFSFAVGAPVADGESEQFRFLRALASAVLL